LVKKKSIAGVDEVGRGSLAGPVFAAAVVLNKDINTKDIIDSKKIPFEKRIALSKYIKKNSTYAIGFASVKEIDKINILNASLLSMKRALKKLKIKPTIAYIDGPFAPKNLSIKCKTFIKGDEKIVSISAASIIAKVEHDKYIYEMCEKYPNLDTFYSLKSNKGYGAKKHIEGIESHGITDWHRKTFGICRKYANT